MTSEVVFLIWWFWSFFCVFRQSCTRRYRSIVGRPLCYRSCVCLNFGCRFSPVFAERMLFLRLCGGIFSLFLLFFIGVALCLFFIFAQTSDPGAHDSNGGVFDVPADCDERARRA